MDQIRIDTPESVDLALEPAGLGSRFIAALVDALIQYAVVFLLVLVGLPTLALTFAMEGDPSMAGIAVIAILFIGLGLLFFLYKLLLEAFWNGQTIGKRVAGIRVVQANGLPVTFLQVVIRNLLRIIDYLPTYYLVGAVTILATSKKQRLGDLAAGTVVVRDRPAGAPVVPVQLSHPPRTDLNRLREHVLRLSEADLAPARGYWERRFQLDGEARARVAPQVAQALAVRMGWQEPLPPHADDFIEEVLYVRAR
ncbi:MAG: RDD family protein [Bacillota bacterium]